MHYSKKQKQGRSQRQLRVGEEIRHGLSDIFLRGESRDPEINEMSITVSEVRVSPDLKNATAFVMPLGGQNKEKMMEAVVRVRHELRSLIGKRLVLKFLPKIHFKLDESYEEASKIDELLSDPKVAKDLASKEESEQA